MSLGEDERASKRRASRRRERREYARRSIMKGCCVYVVEVCMGVGVEMLVESLFCGDVVV